MQAMLDLLLTRRSVKAADLQAPGPTAAQLRMLLTAAARVPDHGKTMPFYFLVFEGKARAVIGRKIADVFVRQNPDAPADKVELEANRFLRAPLVVGVIYRKRRGKHPLWEQMLSVGAACQNMLLAAHAMGFAGNWLSEWHAYDDDVRAALGLDERDMVAGYIHIGTPPADKPEDRDRPDLDEIVTFWEDGAPIKKGDLYDRPKFDFPPLRL